MSPRRLRTLAALVGSASCAASERASPPRQDAPPSSASGAPTAGSPAAATTSELTCRVRTGLEVRPGAIGAVEVGRSVDDLRRICAVVRDTTELDDEGLPARILTIQTSRGVVEATVDGGRVWRVAVNHPGLRTADSVGVGSTLRDLMRPPGARGFEGERGLFVVPAGRCGLSFHLDHVVADAEHRDEWTSDDLGRLPPSTRVDQLLAVRCVPAS